MYLTVGAEGLGLHKGALVAALAGIGLQGGAVGAQGFASVVLFAVQSDHPGDQLLFPLPLGLGVHQLILPCSTE